MTNTQKETDSPEVSNALPFSIREALVQAAAIKDPLARLKAIEEAERRGRALCPRMFNLEA